MKKLPVLIEGSALASGVQSPAAAARHHQMQPFFPLSTAKVTAAAALLAAAGAMAQSLPIPPPQNVLQLAASGTVETPQDLLSLSLVATREGHDPAAVQAELKTALDAALAQARAVARPGQMDVRTGHFAIGPRYGRDGRITAWHGTAELVLEGRDFALITRTAARIDTLTVGGVGYRLSREQRAKVEREAQGIAIERFQAKATDLAKHFGFSGYSLREVAVNANDEGFVPRQRAMAAGVEAARSDMPLPVEAGKSAVTVTVSGSVQLR